MSQNQTQVIVSSNLSGQLWNVIISDLFSGSTLMTYKGAGVTGVKCLDIISDQYIIGAQKDTPIINIWSLNSKDQLHMKMICPHKVTALRVTRDDAYCIVAMNEKIHIWEFASGNLIAILEKHYQSVTCIKVTDDSSHFVSGGDDGIVNIWSLSHIFAAVQNYDYNTGVTLMEGSCNAIEPRHRLSHHSGRITDIHIGFGGLRSRCVTCSIDHTCRIYEMVSGALIITIVFDTPLWSVAMDPAEYYLFVGGDNGNIYETRLYDKPYSNSIRKESSPTFVGHSGPVTCLSISIDGQALVSGSNDNNVKMWHIMSKQCMRTFPHKGPISNLMVMASPSGLFTDSVSKTHSLTHSLPFHPFKRHLINDSHDFESGSAYEHRSITVMNRKNLREHLPHLKRETIRTKLSTNMENVSPVNEDNGLRDEIGTLKKINNQLYSYAMDTIFKNIK